MFRLAAGSTTVRRPSRERAGPSRKWSPRLLGLLTLATLVLAACGSSGGGSSSGFTLKYGVLSGLTGEGAAFGATFADAAQIGINYINQELKADGLANKYKANLVDTQDSQGTATAGVEAAKKLVDIDGIQVMIGDFLSPVTAPVAQTVTIPGHVVQFTGGTAPTLTQLNKSGPTYLWQIVPPDNIQGAVLAQVVGEQLGKHATMNIGGQNSAYGVGLASSFKAAWLAQGGKVGQYVIWDPTLPSFDSQANQLVQGHPNGWFFADYCPTFEKMLIALERTNQWDPKLSWGGDSLSGCQTAGLTYPAGMQSTAANEQDGPSYQTWLKLWNSEHNAGLTYNPGASEAFDAAIVGFLAALAAGSSEPSKIAGKVQSVTNSPGTGYTAAQLGQAIKAVVAGKKIHYLGASSTTFQFNAKGKEGVASYNVYKYQSDGSDPIEKTIVYKGSAS